MPGSPPLFFFIPFYSHLVICHDQLRGAADVTVGGWRCVDIGDKVHVQSVWQQSRQIMSRMHRNIWRSRLLLIFFFLRVNLCTEMYWRFTLWVSCCNAGNINIKMQTLKSNFRAFTIVGLGGLYLAECTIGKDVSGKCMSTLCQFNKKKYNTFFFVFQDVCQHRNCAFFSQTWSREDDLKKAALVMPEV